MTQIVLQPAQDASNYDTMLYSGAPNNNYYNDSIVEIGLAFIERGIWRFDLSSIPTGATITSATLELYVVSYTNSPNIHIARIISGNSDWVISQATWNNRKTGTGWAGSNGCSTSGTDYSSTEMANKTSFTASQMNSFTLNTSEVSAMIAANYGMIGYDTGNTYMRTSPMNDGTAGNRPKLTINYTLTGPFPTFFRS